MACRDGNGLFSRGIFALSIEDKMAAGAFGRARNCGCEKMAAAKNVSWVLVWAVKLMDEIHYPIICSSVIKQLESGTTGRRREIE